MRPYITLLIAQENTRHQPIIPAQVMTVHISLAHELPAKQSAILTWTVNTDAHRAEPQAISLYDMACLRGFAHRLTFPDNSASFTVG